MFPQICMASSCRFWSNGLDYWAIPGSFVWSRFRQWFCLNRPSHGNRAEETSWEDKMTTTDKFQSKLPPVGARCAVRTRQTCVQKRIPDVTFIRRENVTDIQDTKINGVKEPEKMFTLHPFLSTIKDNIRHLNYLNLQFFRSVAERSRF